MKKLVVVTLCLATLAGRARALDCLVLNDLGDMSVNSLGFCIMVANTNPGPDNIYFQTGPAVILPMQTYVITDPFTTIDGFMLAAFATPNTNPAPQELNTILEIEIDGSMILNGASIFRIEADHTVIRGLNIHSGPAFEITIGMNTGGVAGCRIEGNFIGTDITGTVALGSGWLPYNNPYVVGVYITNGSTSNTVGSNGDGAGDEMERNLIAGEELWTSNDPPVPATLAGYGVLISGGFGDVSTLNRVDGNLIGTTRDPAVPLGNNIGIGLLSGSTRNTIENNVIGGNHLDGIWGGVAMGSIAASVQANQIHRNFIGIDPNTDLSVPNLRDGIHFDPGCQDNLIGQVDWARANVISGNERNGVYIAGTGSGGVDSDGNLFVYNIVGLDISGAFAVPNGGHGFLLERVLGGNFIGMGIDGNLISGNGNHGIHLIQSDSNRIESNVIGRNLAEDTGQPNLGDGIRLTCTDAGCSDSNQIEANRIYDNDGDGIGMWGYHQDNQIGPDNWIDANAMGGVFCLLPDASNIIFLNTILNNGWYGVELMGSSPGVLFNDLWSNGWLGIAVFPFFGADADPATAADDVLARPDISGNVVDGNAAGGIYSEDTEPINGRTLHLDNTIGDNGGLDDVVQVWFGAVEILDSAANPITSGAYTVGVQSAFGLLQNGAVPDAGRWGPAGFTGTDVTTWFGLISYGVTNGGTFVDGNPHIVTVSGPTVGSSTYTFDGDNNDVNQGGLPTGITTSGRRRYQLADVITYVDTDGDGEPDITDCAPSDPGYQGASGVPCDADGDGYCDESISGIVMQWDCPNDICAGGTCTPTDCDDTDSGVHPGAAEVLCNTIDENCNGMADNDQNVDGDPVSLCNGDCDDTDPGRYPGNAELCDLIDQDCDNLIDDVPASACDDAVACTDDVCVPASGCQNSPDDLNCDDGNDCTDDVCDSATGCSSTPNTGSCDDGLFCTVSDTCDGLGTCTGSPRDCSTAGDQCNDGVCSEADGACVGQPVVDGTVCDDGLDCTGDDGCVSGSCIGVAVDCSHLDGVCVTGVCSEADGGCVVQPDPDGASCDDGSFCTDGDQCAAGNCVSGAARDCSIAADQCNAGVCDEDADQCLKDPLADGTACNDDDECTVNDACLSGVCGGDQLDADEDGHGDEACGGDDCNDGDASIHPGATEVCGDEIDQDCSGEDLQCGCADVDEDGFEDETCGGQDCDDTDAEVNPDADEVCNDEIDNDCDGDTDGDDPDCAACPDADFDGHADAACGGDDCDDTNGNVYPGAEETCGDTIDQDCNGVDLQCGCEDADGDGFEDDSCGGSDCDDGDASVNPDADEVCDDAVDNDCNGETDAADAACACADSDGDGHENATCGGTDCDDADATVNPDADEVCDDAVDNDCDGDVDADDPDCGCPDADEDGFASAVCGGSDCDDGDAAIHPDATELCEDGADNDCDGDTDYDDEDCDRGKSGTCGCGTSTPWRTLPGAWIALLGILFIRKRGQKQR